LSANSCASITSAARRYCAASHVVGQVQVDAGRLDRGMPGLGLHRLQRHAGLAQPGQAGVPQLVTGRVLQASAATGAFEDLVQPVGRQRMPAALPLQHHEHELSRGIGWTFVLEVGSDVVEEPARDWDQSLPAALAVGDEHPPLGDPQVLQSQAEHLATP
jgi:hypothetical protein